MKEITAKLQNYRITELQKLLKNYRNYKEITKITKNSVLHSTYYDLKFQQL